MTFVYVGTQRAGPGTGLSVSPFNEDTGELGTPRLVAETDDPSIFVINSGGPGGAHLYACNSGTPGGVSAFAVDVESGDLAFLNSRPCAEGRGPSQLCLDRAGRFVLEANYGGGYVEVRAVGPDGALGAQTAFVRHHGQSVDPVRQTRPYVHAVTVDPTNRFALVADLGIDQIVTYRFDATTGALLAHTPAHAKVKPGSGPRHMAWHPDGRTLYVIAELSNTIIVFDWDAERGVLAERQTVLTLPAGWTGANTAAEIAVHPDGRSLYASNRGHGSLAVFAIDPLTHDLSLRQHIASGGVTPRYVAFDPTARWILVTSHDDDVVAVFERDRQTGALTPHGEPLSMRRPFGIACVALRRTWS